MRLRLTGQRFRYLREGRQCERAVESVTPTGLVDADGVETCWTLADARAIAQRATQGARHVAIIMDGNGRWAKKRHLPRAMGHKKGVEAVRKVVEGVHQWPVQSCPSGSVTSRIVRSRPAPRLFGRDAETWTASMLNARMALASCRRVGIVNPRGNPAILPSEQGPGHTKSIENRAPRAAQVRD